MASSAAVWANEAPATGMRQLVKLPLSTPSPLGPNFAWPTWQQIRETQTDHPREASALGDKLVVDKEGVGRLDGRVWVPPGALDLQLSLLVIAHAGAMGHRGVAATRTALQEIFVWTKMGVDVEAFVSE